jgi:tetrapyrrole methylase family protein/MazG family protein/ATP diphosphatase
MSSIHRLLQIMARLRSPGGCPWDLEQDFKTIAPYTIEEAYEVADAIEREDLGDLRDELGDLLFQVVFHAQMAQERRAFGFGDVVDAICDKMERRHPHVFGNATIADAQAQTVAWEEQKRRERESKGGSVLANVPVGLPALTRADKIGKRAAAVGFEWPDAMGALDKVEEEIGELRAAIAGGETADMEAELGDLLYSVVNVCRYVKVDPENALRLTNAKFERRFRFIEQRLKEQGLSPQEASLEQMDRLWDEAKRQFSPHSEPRL